MYLKRTLSASALLLALTLTAASAQARDIVMGLIPAENNEEMIQKFEPMRLHLEKKLGEKVKVFTATDYAGVIEAMKKKRVDIAWFGPLSYYLAEQEAGAVAFAVGIREGSNSHTYKSIIIAPCDEGIKSIMELKGKSVAFVDPASTSGGLMPTYMVKKETGMMRSNSSASSPTPVHMMPLNLRSRTRPSMPQLTTTSPTGECSTRDSLRNRPIAL